MFGCDDRGKDRYGGAIITTVGELAPGPPRVARAPGRRTLRNVKIVAAVVVLTVLGIEVGLVLPYITSALNSIRHLQPGWLVIALVAEAGSMAMFARLQRRMMIAGGVRIPVFRMVGMTYAANAMSVTLPAGQVASSTYAFRKLRSWGAGGPLVTFALIASGVLSTLALAVILVLAATFAGSGSANPWLIGLEVVVAVAAMIAVPRLARRPALLRGIGGWGLRLGTRILRRPADTGQATLSQAIEEMTLIRPRGRDWLLGLIFAMLKWGLDLLCLIAACRAVGAGGPSLPVALVAYAAGMTASSLPLLLPGGLGVVDGVLILALVRGGLTASASTAGVLIYRLISFGLVAAIGWVLFLIVDRARRHEPVPASSVDSAGSGGPAEAAEAV
jgi:uncharacterized protein (TIRG00374 family)